MTAKLPPCPLCRSIKLNEFSHWTSCDDGMIEIKKVQCTACFCEAPVATWSTRKPPILPAAWLLVEALRAEEGHSVTLICDNPDFGAGANNAVDCCGDYTGWAEQRFEGETQTAALMAAYLKMTGGAVAPDIAEAIAMEARQT